MRVCVTDSYFQSDVVAALQPSFDNRQHADGSRGFFHPDNFTFGQPVLLSRIYAAAMRVTGVRHVDVTMLRRQGDTAGWSGAQERRVCDRTTGNRHGSITIRIFPTAACCGSILWEDAMNNPLDPTLRDLTDCGCCAGTTAQTPATIDNRPGLPSIAFGPASIRSLRLRCWPRLSSQDRPALRGLRTRENDDFTIALLDAFASMADVLTFYSERIANEAYLRTATERRSVLELARAISYELAPGVAADVLLAFTGGSRRRPGHRNHPTRDQGPEHPWPGRRAAGFRNDAGVPRSCSVE